MWSTLKNHDFDHFWRIFPLIQPKRLKGKMIKFVDFSLLFKVDLIAPKYHLGCLETLNTFTESKRSKRCPKKNGFFSYDIHYRFLEGIAYPCFKPQLFWKRLKTQVRPSKKSCFFQKKLSQELGWKIKIFFKVQMCNIENYDFRKKPIVDFQEKFSWQEKFSQKELLFN